MTLQLRLIPGRKDRYRATSQFNTSTKLKMNVQYLIGRLFNIRFPPSQMKGTTGIPVRGLKRPSNVVGLRVCAALGHGREYESAPPLHLMILSPPMRSSFSESVFSFQCDIVATITNHPHTYMTAFDLCSYLNPLFPYRS
jgi:hypothetical protein